MVRECLIKNYVILVFIFFTLTQSENRIYFHISFSYFKENVRNTINIILLTNKKKLDFMIGRKNRREKLITHLKCQSPQEI